MATPDPLTKLIIINFINMKKSRFLLLLVLTTHLQLECKAKNEPLVFEAVDTAKKVKNEGDNLKTTMSSMKPLKETEASPMITKPTDDDNSDEEQPKVQDENEPPPATLDWEEIRNNLHASLRLVTRCSRRYFPGLCSEPVHSVWTYSFHHQTCIERLGCRTVFRRSNRFATYQECMYKCRSLIDVYTHILAYQGKQAVDEGTSAEDHYEDDDYSLRRGKGARRQSIETLENLISTLEEYTDDEQPFAVPESSEGEPPDQVQSEMPVDIDSVPADYMDVQYDLNSRRYRRARGT